MPSRNASRCWPGRRNPIFGSDILPLARHPLRGGMTSCEQVPMRSAGGETGAGFRDGIICGILNAPPTSSDYCWLECPVFTRYAASRGWVGVEYHNDARKRPRGI